MISQGVNTRNKVVNFRQTPTHKNKTKRTRQTLINNSKEIKYGTDLRGW